MSTRTPSPHPANRRWARLVAALALAATAAAGCDGKKAPAPRQPSPLTDAAPGPGPAPGPVTKPSPRPQTPPTQAAIDDAARLAPSIRGLAVDLHRQLAAGNGNILVSPTSVAVALGLAQLGARGTTAAELARALHLSGALADGAALAGMTAVLQGKTDDWELASANRLWAADGLAVLPDYLTKTGANLERLDFANPDAAARAINAWIAAQTRDRIPELLTAADLDAATRLVLTNALYLKAAWQSPFEAGSTIDAPFTALDGSSAPTQLMLASETFRLAARDGAHAVELPYAGGALSFVAILPDDAKAFRAYEQALDAKRLGVLLDALAPQLVNVALPRFELRAKTPLRGTLEALGVKAAFTDQAEFGGIAAEALKIDAVIHEGYIRLDEKGTEAAAATAVVMRTTSAPMGEPYAFRADRPFIYLIRHTATGAILFMGRLAAPAPIAG